MIASTIFDILKQSKLDNCNVLFKFVNGNPVVVIKFNVSGAKSTDSEKLQKLRKALSSPMLGNYEVSELETIDGLIVEDLGHKIESLGDSVSEVLKEQKKATNAKAKNSRSSQDSSGETTAQAANTAKSHKTASTESLESEIGQGDTQSLFGGLDLADFRV